MKVCIHPLYTQVFSGALPVDGLRQGEAELRSPREADFTLNERTWKDTIKSVVLFLAQGVLFPWGFYLSFRWCVQRLLMGAIYPVQNRIMKKILPRFANRVLDTQRVNGAAHLSASHIMRHVKLVKDGVSFSGLLIGKPETIRNRKWVLQATGNLSPIEYTIHNARDYEAAGYNILLVNSPGVGRSEGTMTPKKAGEVQKTAALFLKRALRAERIVMAGYSIGGAVTGRGALEYNFEGWDTGEVDYLVIRQVTFGSVSEIAGKFSPEFGISSQLAARLVRWSGCEMDNVEASRRLVELGIPEAIIQAAQDQIIPYDASLMHGLLRRGITAGKSFHNLPQTGHNDSSRVLGKTVEVIQAWEAGRALRAAM